MWIENLPNGKFKFVERYFDEKTGKHKKVSTTLNSNSAQAEKKATQILMKRINAKLNKKRNSYPSFKEAYEEYIKFKKKRLKVSAWQHTKSAYNHLKCIDDFLLDKITAADIQSVVDDVQYQNGSTARYARKVRNIVTAVINRYNAINNTNLQLDLSQIEFKRDVKSTKLEYIDSSILSDEIEKMYQLMPEIQAEMMEAQILTGMRFAELAGITKKDWDGDKIIINKSIESANKRAVGTTKNAHSSRVIDSSERINEIFRHRILLNDATFGKGSLLIFANQRNKPMFNYYINKKLKNVHPEYTTHIMRHTHISLLAENEMPLKYIMERVGHNDPKTTLRIYTHVTNRMKEKGKKVLNNLF